MDPRDRDAVRRLASWTTVEVVLLDINAIVGNPGQGDVLIGDVLDLHAVSIQGLQENHNVEVVDEIYLQFLWFQNSS